jgi:hypothetical protein
MTDENNDPQQEEADARRRFGEAQAGAEETLEHAEDLSDESDSGSEKEGEDPKLAYLAVEPVDLGSLGSQNAEFGIRESDRAAVLHG